MGSAVNRRSHAYCYTTGCCSNIRWRRQRLYPIRRHDDSLHSQHPAETPWRQGAGIVAGTTRHRQRGDTARAFAGVGIRREHQAHEVDTVRAIIKKVTGEDVSTADVRVAARSKIFETAPLEQHLKQVARLVAIADRASIAKALAEVILSDQRVTNKEVRFFNAVSAALELTPAALCGLFSED